MTLLSEAPVLVTGACGLVGRATVTALRARGLPVVATDLGSRANREHAASLPADRDLAWRWADLTAPEQARGLVKASAPRAVVHLAAVIPPACYDDPGLAEAVNVGGTRHLTEAVVDHAPQARFVHASSVAVHGSRNPHRDLGLLGPDTPLAPSDLYGRHKAAAEEVVRAIATPWVVLRLGGVMTTEVSGGNDADTSYFSASLPDDGRIQTVDVRDVARAFAAAVDADVVGEILMIGGDESHRLVQRDIATGYTAALGMDGAVPAGLPGDPDDDSTWFATDWMDTARAQEALGFQQVSWPRLLEEVREQVGWKRYLLRLVGPPMHALAVRRSPYAGTGLTHADPWGAVERRWPAATS
ncbi:NAD(P)-dependent oxidoreductase [uncultured Nocardioides sp.]|uniref:NAD-dependent epimerase/dehydratase family protein n=1 Tax=uncultured Nocardioides sp. TaxID=198441 RepID=UPI00261845B0|nr:NAD-dependent epimerase/dehydratase family protein [uncultured Nocardioides sp.]